MSTSEQRLAANRANALKSTGPKTKNGKAVACLNATQHGLFSARLLLDDEEPAGFQRLLADLDSTLILWAPSNSRWLSVLPSRYGGSGDL
jgi:hypothetical protein